jgi:uracil-DNA glycosylase family 4
MAKQIHSTGPVPCDYALIAERPGKVEARIGRVLCGPSGDETDRYLAINSGIPRHAIFCSNVVKDWREDEPPSHDEIERDRALLERELRNVQPKYILAMGLYSARWFLGDDIAIEWSHGLAFPWRDSIVMPAYHSASGLHMPANAAKVAWDFESFGRLIKGEALPTGHLKDAYPNPIYKEVRHAFSISQGWNSSVHQASDPTSSLRESAVCQPVSLGASNTETAPKVTSEASLCQRSSTGRQRQNGGASPETLQLYGLSENASTIIAVDTEGSVERPWSVQVSSIPGTACVIRGPITETVPLIVGHNLLHDLPVLSAMGITVEKFEDTLLMAALLQTEPQGLKALARRHCGMLMSDYDSIVAPARREKALQYLSRVLDYATAVVP